MYLFLAVAVGLVLGWFQGRYSGPREIKIKISGIKNRDGSVDAMAILDPE